MSRRFAGGLLVAIGCAPVATPTAPPPMPPLVNRAALADRDADGVMDSLDGCPNEPGGAPGRGCPVHDADALAGEAALATDRCPNEPETMNGYQDDDGCPDVIPLRMSAREALMPVVVRMQGSAIDPGALPRVDETIRTLTEHPEVRVEVAGHSDSREGGGDVEQQRNIGLARATAVRDYLVAKGAIDPRRVTVRSAGPDEPLDSNLSAAGRAKNRRVVLTIIQR